MLRGFCVLPFFLHGHLPIRQLHYVCSYLFAAVWIAALWGAALCRLREEFASDFFFKQVLRVKSEYKQYWLWVTPTHHPLNNWHLLRSSELYKHVFAEGPAVQNDFASIQRFDFVNISSLCAPLCLKCTVPVIIPRSVLQFCPEVSLAHCGTKLVSWNSGT